MKFRKAKEMSPEKRKKAIIYNSIIIFLCCVIIFCGFQVGSYYWQEWRNNSQNDEIIEDVIALPPSEQDGNESTVTSSVADTGYKFAPIPESVDFNKLLSKNTDVVGWLFNQNGVINYPIMKGEDNEYYLDHTINRKKNVNGSIFMNYLNSSDFSDNVSFIYGHSMKNGTMFATLLRYRNQSYYNAYPAFYLYTPNGNYKIEIFSAYQTTVADKVFFSRFRTADNSELVSHAFSKSKIRADVSVGKEDKIVVMSTCAHTSEDARFVVIGKLTQI